VACDTLPPHSRANRQLRFTLFVTGSIMQYTALYKIDSYAFSLNDSTSTKSDRGFYKLLYTFLEQFLTLMLLLHVHVSSLLQT
jgi:hypothetical protein